MTQDLVYVCTFLENRPECYYLRPKLEAPPPSPPKVGDIVVCIYTGCPVFKGLRLWWIVSKLETFPMDAFPWENRQEVPNDLCISLCKTHQIISISM